MTDHLEENEDDEAMGEILTIAVNNARSRFDDVSLLLRNMYGQITSFPVHQDYELLSTLAEKGYMKTGMPYKEADGSMGEVTEKESASFDLSVEILKAADDISKILSGMAEKANAHVAKYGDGTETSGIPPRNRMN